MVDVHPDWREARKSIEEMEIDFRSLRTSVQEENFWDSVRDVAFVEKGLESLEADLVNPGPKGVPVKHGASPLAAAVLTPIAAEAGKLAAEEVRRKVEQERGKRRATHGAFVDYYASFRGREAATHLARKYQDNGIPAFVYFDAARPVSSLVAGTEERVVGEAPPGPGGFVRTVEIGGEVRRELVVPTDTLPPEEVLEQERFLMRIPELDPATGQPVRGMWVVEIGEPTDAERELFGAGGLAVVRPGDKPPKDPAHRKVLFFPPKSLPTAEFGAGDDRPSLLDALVDGPVVFGGRLVGSLEPAPCDCATIPETGKKLCTRTGVIGMLDQAQVATLCSEVRDKPNGRVDRARALRAAQEVCGTLVENIADSADRMGARIDCLRDQLGESI